MDKTTTQHAHTTRTMTTFDNNTKSRNLKVWEEKLRVALTGMLPFNEEYGAQRRYMVGEGVRQWFDKQNHAVLDKIARLLLENSHGLEMFTDFALEEQRKEDERKREEEDNSSDDDEHDEDEHDKHDEEDEEYEHDDDEHDEHDEEHDEEEHDEHDEEDDDEEHSKFSNGLLETWRSAGMRATIIHRYPDNSCDISMKSPSGATVSARVSYAFVVALNAE